MANEKRLIDANALTDVIEHTDWYHISVNGKLAEGANPEHNIPLFKADDIYEAIENAPTVDAVEVVHGRWEDVCEIKSFKHTNIPVVECSNCEMRFCDIINNHHFMYHYCPNCGAKMDGDGNV